MVYQNQPSHHLPLLFTLQLCSSQIKSSFIRLFRPPLTQMQRGLQEQLVKSLALEITSPNVYNNYAGYPSRL